MAALAFERQTPLTAIVHAADGIRFVASANCPADVANQVGGYIRARCDFALWPSVAAEVKALLDDDHPYAAIALYFDRVGERWDDERLDIGGISFGDERGSSRTALAERTV